MAWRGRNCLSRWGLGAGEFVRRSSRVIRDGEHRLSGAAGVAAGRGFLSVRGIDRRGLVDSTRLASRRRAHRFRKWRPSPVVVRSCSPSLLPRCPVQDGGPVELDNRARTIAAGTFCRFWNRSRGGANLARRGGMGGCIITASQWRARRGVAPRRGAVDRARPGSRWPAGDARRAGPLARRAR